MADGGVQLKVCTKCGQAKSTADFYCNYGVIRPSCKQCSKAAAKAWVENNREKRREIQRKKYHRRKSDPAFMDKCRAAGRESAKRMRLKPGAPERLRAYQKEQRLKDPLPFMVRGARTRARDQGVPFDLTVEWARSRWTGFCQLTGLAFEQCTGGQGQRSPSLDRVRPELGYVQSNCRFVLSAVNSFKGAGTDEEMFFLAAALLRR